MKGLLIYVVIGFIALFALSSCSSQKRLQRRIERHGIKESIGFITRKYPEYFKSKDTTIWVGLSSRITFNSMEVNPYTAWIISPSEVVNEEGKA